MIKDGDPSNNARSNIEFLCESCHVARHHPPERALHGRLMTVLAGFLDPQTRADQVRVFRAENGMPAGMGVKPHLERKRPTGSPKRADDDA